MWDLIVSVPDHCLSFYFSRLVQQLCLHHPYLSYLWTFYVLDGLLLTYIDHNYLGLVLCLSLEVFTKFSKNLEYVPQMLN